MGFSFFFVVLWSTEISVMGCTVSPEHGKLKKNLHLAMCAVVVSKTSCKDRNHRILRGVIAPHQDFFFFCKNHDFSRFLINFSTVVVVKHTHVVDPKLLTHIHSHRDLNSLSLSTESTYLLLEGRAARTPGSTRRRLELQR
jgi:hypothetical protein